jgi:soluble lytic murein transglycosylase
MPAGVALLLLAALAASTPAIGDGDLRPLIEPGLLTAVRRAVQEGRPEEAAALLDGREEPPARFLRADALVRAGKGDEALRALAGLAVALPDVADRVAAIAAQAEELAGRPAEAAAAWSRVPEGSLLWPEALLARARIEVAAGRTTEAAEVLRPLLDLPAPGDLSRPDPAARALLAAGKARASRPDGAAEARRLLLACWSLHPLAPQAAECRARLESLPEPQGGAPGDEEALRRAEALLDWNRNEAALAEARRLGGRLPAPGPEAPQSCRAAFVRGKALRKQRQYAPAGEELGRVVERCSDPVLRAKALYLLAVARANVRTADGVATYLGFAEQYPDHAQADDAMFFAADLLSRDGEAARAERLLKELADRYPRGDFRAEAMFRSAWIRRRGGNLGGAIAALERIEADYRDADPYEHARAAYWRGRALAERGGRGDATAARAVWAEVAARYPADYYGLLARARLGAPQPALAAPEPVPGGFRYRAGGLAGDPHFRSALVLLRLGMGRAAAEELGAVDRRAVAGNGEGPEPLLLLAELLDRAGDARAALGLLRSQGRQVLRQPPEGLGERIWRVAYPPAWRDEVLRHAPGAGVPPDLLQAIMREESALDPTVVSAAGAVGLTQLMPATARQVARRLRLPDPARADLTDAALNIRLGAVHLGDLLRRFGGSAALAVAAYNAGETPVRGWWRARASMPADEFVEEIPLQETRGYVKRVLRSYAAYRLLYGKPGERPVKLDPRLPAPP